MRTRGRNLIGILSHFCSDLKQPRRAVKIIYVYSKLQMWTLNEYRYSQMQYNGSH